MTATTRLAAPLMARLAEAGFTVGDNEPYSGALEGDTLWRHGTMRGLPHVLIEMRQDLVGDDEQAQAFALQAEACSGCGVRRHGLKQRSGRP